jgi:NTE family protein
MPREPEPFALQLAIQGGGAKFCALLAVVETIQTLQDERVLKVTRVAGTSAGAVAGCLLAAGVPAAEVRARLEGIGAKRVARLFPELSRPEMVGRILRGKPFWSDAELQQALDEIFTAIGVRDFENLAQRTKTQALVVAADLTNSRPVIHGIDPKQPLVPAIMDSCALPFFFRSAASTVVDGGICENLPSEVLDEMNAEEYGPIVGISFAELRSGRRPDGFLAFARALLETAMRNSMQRAKRRLGPESIFSIETEIDTFDFKGALEHGFGPAYADVRQKAERFLRDFVERGMQQRQVLAGDPWAEQPISTMTRLGDIYRAHHSNRKLKYVRCKFVVQAECMPSPEESLRHPDLARYSLIFESGAEPVFCHSITLSEAPHARFLGRASWVLRDAALRKIETLHIPARNRDAPRDRQLILFFDPVLGPGSPYQPPYSLVFQEEVANLMAGLHLEGKDELGLDLQRAEGRVGRVDLVLYLPQRYTGARMVSSSRPEALPLGRPMTDTELGEYDPPPGFRAIGWTGQEIEPSERTLFAADIVV